jgi:hypothetical protein
MKNQNLLLKAAQQALSDSLGYDEAQAYFMLLNKNEKGLENEFSYSKRYRIMKRLFDLSAVARFKQKDKDFFSYILLPPSFLYFGSEPADRIIVEFLESVYLRNYSELLEQEFSQIMMKDERPLLTFLLKYFMKDSARLLVKELDLKKVLGEKANKVTFVNQSDEFKRKGTIDRKITFDFVSIPRKTGIQSREYIGYLSIIPNEKHKIVH